jgi:hypothetical protein
MLENRFCCKFFGFFVFVLQLKSFLLSSSYARGQDLSNSGGEEENPTDIVGPASQSALVCRPARQFETGLQFGVRLSSPHFKSSGTTVGCE